MRRILIVGCGDIATRVAPLLTRNYHLFGLVRRKERYAALRETGITPVSGDLDKACSLGRIAGIADIVLHFAPPSSEGKSDTRTRRLLSALARGKLPRHMIYLSTSGVYGDCGGDIVGETRPPHPQTARAQRRIDAERQIHSWAQRNKVCASILRVPGIYAANRLPVERLKQGVPAIIASEDSYTNHIHADDLARIVVAALRYGSPNRIYHASDDSELKMGDYFDAVAAAQNLPHPPRLPRLEVKRTISPMLWSFMNESRRLTNSRMKQELKVALRYPTVEDMLAECRKR